MTQKHAATRAPVAAQAIFPRSRRSITKRGFGEQEVTLGSAAKPVSSHGGKTGLHRQGLSAAARAVFSPPVSGAQAAPDRTTAWSSRPPAKRAAAGPTAAGEIMPRFPA